MKIAYLISAHKDPGQLGRMLKALCGDNVWFFIHIDAKAEQEPFKNAALQTEVAHISFISKRLSVNWEGISKCFIKSFCWRHAYNPV